MAEISSEEALEFIFDRIDFDHNTDSNSFRGANEGIKQSFVDFFETYFPIQEEGQREEKPESFYPRIFLDAFKKKMENIHIPRRLVYVIFEEDGDLDYQPTDPINFTRNALDVLRKIINPLKKEAQLETNICDFIHRIDLVLYEEGKNLAKDDYHPNYLPTTYREDRINEVKQANDEALIVSSIEKAASKERVTQESSCCIIS